MGTRACTCARRLVAQAHKDWPGEFHGTHGRRSCGRSPLLGHRCSCVGRGSPPSSSAGCDHEATRAKTAADPAGRRNGRRGEGPAVDWDENDLLLKQIDARGPALDRCVRLHDAHTSPSRRAPLCKHANAHILHERRLRYVSASSGSSTLCVTNGDKHLPIHIANATRGDGPI